MLRKIIKGAPHQKYFLRDGREVPGCSGIAKITDGFEGLLRYTWKQGKDGKPYGAERDDAADAGEIAHALVEAYLVGDTLDLTDYSEEAQRLGNVAYEKLKMWWEEQKMVFMHAELQLLSHEHEYGGTLDIVGRNREREVCLIDMKAVKTLRTAHGIQVIGGYAPLYNENFPNDPIQKACIVRLPKDESDIQPLWVDPMLFPYYRAVFLASLAAHNARFRLDQVCPITPPWFKKGYRNKK